MAEKKNKTEQRAFVWVHTDGRISTAVPAKTDLVLTLSSENREVHIRRPFENSKTSITYTTIPDIVRTFVEALGLD